MDLAGAWVHVPISEIDYISCRGLNPVGLTNHAPVDFMLTFREEEEEGDACFLPFHPASPLAPSLHPSLSPSFSFFLPLFPQEFKHAEGFKPSVVPEP